MDRQTEVVLMIAAAGMGAYYLYKKNKATAGSAAPKRIEKYHKRALLAGHATSRGHRGATRYVQTGHYLNTLPEASGRSYLVTRAMAEKQYNRNLRPAHFFTNV